MPIRDLLLQMNSYPEPTPRRALAAAMALAELFDARLMGPYGQSRLRESVPDCATASVDATLPVLLSH